MSYNCPYCGYKLFKTYLRQMCNVSREWYGARVPCSSCNKIIHVVEHRTVKYGLEKTTEES
ncbi:hypothetical protein [Methanobrevibacter sp. DSM 116169]|uniref:hypothetical protein n=1 Tax=Methanobrevibacter sp. DSM 116169 TaxID=3242727 RepID=UPI0038FC1BA9